MYIVAVTACMSGVAHTYMAAEKIERMGTARGFKVRVETQGALGIENPLTEQEIADADLALLITDITIEGEERFADCPTLRVATGLFLKEAERVLHKVEQYSALSGNKHIVFS